MKTLEEAMTPETSLVSVMAVNNEIGKTFALYSNNNYQKDI